MRKNNPMNKKVLWISIASVATLGIGGFLFWRSRKKKKEAEALDAEQVEATEETKQIEGEQEPTPPPHIDIEENVVYLSAKWCPACQTNEKTAQALYAKYKDKVEFRMVDADEEIAKSYGFQLGLRSIPVLAFVSEGEVLETMIGPKSMQEYDEMFVKYFPSLKPATPKAKMVKTPVQEQPPIPPVPQIAPPEEQSEEVKQLPAPSSNGVEEHEEEATQDA